MRNLIDVLYEAQYLADLKDMMVKSAFIRESLGREKLKKISKEGLVYILDKCDVHLSSRLKRKDFIMLLISIDELIFGKNTFKKRLRDFCEINEIKDWEASSLLFYTAPKSFFLPDAFLLKFADSKWKINSENMSYFEFNSECLKKYKSSEYSKVFSNPLEFSCALKNYYKKEGGSSNPLIDFQDLKLIDELTASLKKISLFRVEEFQIKWQKELFSSFSMEQKNALLERMEIEKIHPYLKRLISHKISKTMVVDGSNLIHAGLLKPDILRLKSLMNNLAVYKELFYPVFFVFDANVQYIIDSSSMFWRNNFVSNNFVRFFSPADELILKMAWEKNAVALSNDKFRDFNAQQVKVLRFSIDYGGVRILE